MAQSGTVRKLYLNIGKKPDEASIISATVDTPAKGLFIVENDIVDYELYFFDYDSEGEMQQIELNADTEIRFGARQRSPVGTLDLFSEEDWTKEADGDNFKYTGRVSFVTTQLSAALESVPNVGILANIEVSDDLSDPTSSRTVAYLGGTAYKDMAGNGASPETVDSPFYINIDNTDSPYSYSRLAYRYIAADVTSGSILVNLPDDPQEGDMAIVSDELLQLGGSYTITVDPQSNQLEWEGEAADSAVMSGTVGLVAKWRWNGNLWKLQQPSVSPLHWTIDQLKLNTGWNLYGTLTGLTGGAATDLDSLTTTGTNPDIPAVGTKVSFITGGADVAYVLLAGGGSAPVEDGVYIVYPDDRDGSTNDVYWSKLN